ncbi:MAG: hypothetical protein QXW77_03355 [Candidatus Hadarchaeales archaeon]
MVKIWSKEVIETKSYLKGGLSTVKIETRIFTVMWRERCVDRIREKIGRIVGILKRRKNAVVQNAADNY